MYVEDDADTRELVSYVLARAGYEVVVAENYKQAARLAQTTSFDLYLIDNWMPGGSGIELSTSCVSSITTRPSFSTPAPLMSGISRLH